MTLTNEIQEEAVHYPYSVVVRFRGEGKPYSFGAMDSNYLKDDWVVVETQQGMEMGQVQADCLDVDKYGLHVPTKPVIRKASEIKAIFFPSRSNSRMPFALDSSLKL